MYARVVTVQVQPDKLDETINLYEDSVLSAARQQKGFQNGMLLVDRNTGKGVSITLWETEADLAASESSGYFQAQIAKFASLFAGPPTRELYQVAVNK